MNKNASMNTFYQKALKEMEKKSPDFIKVKDLLVGGVDAKCGDSAYALATWYLHGYDEAEVKQSYSKAIDLLEIAVNGNIPSAAYDLAICFEKGESVEINEQKAFELYVKAALFGDSQSFHEVGRCYYHGIGVSQDQNLADIWLDRAESMGIHE